MDPIILPFLAQFGKTAVGGWLLTNHAWLFEGIGASVTLAILGFMAAFARECLRACGRLCLFCVRAVRRPRKATPTADPATTETKPSLLVGTPDGPEASEIVKPQFLRATSDEVKEFTRVSPEFDPFAKSRQATLRHMNLPPRPKDREGVAYYQVPRAQTSYAPTAELPPAMAHRPARRGSIFGRLTIPKLFFLAAGLNAVWALITWLL